MTLDLLAESALRAALLGAAVWLPLRLSRLSDARTETGIWTMVLVAALAMPFLAYVLPERLTVSLPFLSFLSPVAAQSVVGGEPAMEQFSAPHHWFAAHGLMLCWSLYAAVTLLCLMRLVTGLALTLRLYRRASPVTEDWAHGRAIRASAAIKSPISFAACILLPADYHDWSEAKRQAVLAHEGAHIARGDFFIQLLAMIYRALFWFSPFAWWLQAKLSELAETASDEAAVRRLQDRAAYAEILVDVSRRAHPAQALAAMAKGGIQQRVERILADRPQRILSLPLRLLVIVCLAPLALVAADTRAEIAPVALAMQAAARAHNLPSAQNPAPVIAASATRPRRTAHRHLRVARGDEDAPSYNPRALLEDSETIVLPTIVPVGNASKTKTRGRKPPAGVIYLPQSSD